MISVRPKSPTAIATKSMPSVSSITPKVSRGIGELASVPASPAKMPTTIITTALKSDPLASTIEHTRPSTISEKYSTGPNFSASAPCRGRIRR